MDIALEKAKELIRKYEGCKLKAYKPIEGDKHGWAIGYGYTRPWVTEGCVISQAWAEELLHEHVAELADQVALACSGCPHRITDNELAALVSFAYNVGLGNFSGSTMRRLLINGRFAEAAEQFDLWVHEAGKVAPGLVRRRAEEKALFLTPEEAPSGKNN